MGHKSKVPYTNADNVMRSDFYNRPYGIVIYTDGSYNNITRDFGCGIVLDLMTEQGTKVEKRFVSADSGSDIYVGSRNITGEVTAMTISLEWLEKVLSLGVSVSNVVVVYDYEGIEKWVTKKGSRWKANKDLTQSYVNLFDTFCRKHPDVTIEFLWVRGHTDIEGNELADRIAGEASGVLSPSLEFIQAGIIPAIDSHVREVL